MSLFWPLSAAAVVAFLAYRGGASITRLAIAILFAFVGVVIGGGLLCKLLDISTYWSGPLGWLSVPIWIFYLHGTVTK